MAFSLDVLSSARVQGRQDHKCFLIAAVTPDPWALYGCDPGEQKL